MKLVHQNIAAEQVKRPIFLICVFRDEQLLLEYFIDYYRMLGVTHFIMVDNRSEDQGPEYLRRLVDTNIQLYRTEESYREAAYGTHWINQLLRQHCPDQYCFVVDVDELFRFDSRYYKSLTDLIGAMESANTNVVPTMLLDMYPKKTNDLYQKGQDFLTHSHYFDSLNSEYYENRGTIYQRFNFVVGGVRHRVLGVKPCIQKMPFFKFDFDNLAVSPGCHFFQIDGDVQLNSDEIRLHFHPGVLLHFKFIKPLFKSFVDLRVARNEDWNNSVEYRAYLDALSSQQGALNFYDQKYSRKYDCDEDLEAFFNRTATGAES